MGYNDPYGDNHEQKNLLGGGAEGRLNQDFTELFGPGPIKHSDFRASNISGVKITKLGKENFEAFVDGDETLKAGFDQETKLSKKEFGKLMWKEYVNSKSGVPTSIEQHQMVFDNVQEQTTWVAPQETASGTPQPTWNNPITINLEFGETIEFEVLFNGMGDKFENFRRYMSDNYQWSVTRRSGGTISLPITLTTSRGMSRNKHAFQARYAFTAAEFTGDQIFYVQFTPKDNFNNHDNMHSNLLTSRGPSWGTCCILKPKPISAARAVELTTDYDMEDLSDDNTLCVDEETMVQTKSSVLVNDPSTVGDVQLQFLYKTPSGAESVWGTQSINNDSIPAVDQVKSLSITAPDRGEYLVRYFKTSGRVIGAYYDHSDTKIGSWSYSVESDWTAKLTIASAPSSDVSYVSAGVPGMIPDVAERSRLQSYDIGTRLPPGEISTSDGARESISNTMPGVLIDHTSSNPQDYFVFSTPIADNTVNSVEYYSNDNWVKHSDMNDTSSVINKYPSPVPGNKHHSLSDTINITSSALWRVSRQFNIPGTSSACTRAGSELTVVSVSDDDLTPPEDVTLQISWSNGIMLQIDWSEQPEPQFEVATPDGNINYKLDVKYIVSLYDTVTKSTINLSDIVTDQTQVIIDSTNNTAYRRELIPGRAYQAVVRTRWHGADQIQKNQHANSRRRVNFLKTWTSESTSSNSITVFDCNAPDLRLGDVKLSSGLVVPVTTLNNFKQQTGSPQWYDDNDEIYMYADSSGSDIQSPERVKENILIARVECNVREILTLTFSTKRQGASPDTVLTGGQTRVTIGDREQAQAGADILFYEPSSDTGFDIDEFSAVVLSPMNSKNFKSVLKFHVEPVYDDENDRSGNRGYITVERYLNDLVRVTVQDVEGVEPSIYSRAADTERYRFDVYATVILT